MGIKKIYDSCKCGFRKVPTNRMHCRKCRPIKGGQPKKVYKIIHDDEVFEITTKHALYMLRHHIIERCYVSKKDAKWYANIGVCREWKEDPKSFYQWCIENNWEKGLTIDRLDSEKDYEPSNCQFISRSDNSRKAMQKICKITENEARQVKLLLKIKRQIDVSRELGISYGIVRAIKEGRAWNHV